MVLKDVHLGQDFCMGEYSLIIPHKSFDLSLVIHSLSMAEAINVENFSDVKKNLSHDITDQALPSAHRLKIAMASLAMAT